LIKANRSCGDTARENSARGRPAATWRKLTASGVRRRPTTQTNAATPALSRSTRTSCSTHSPPPA